MNKFLKIGLSVLLIIFGASLFIPTTTDCYLVDNKKRAISEMHALNTAIKMFYINVGRYPTQEEGLEILWNTEKGLLIYGYRKDGYIGRQIKDPWNNDYQYSIDQKSENKVKLWSLGDIANKGEPIEYVHDQIKKGAKAPLNQQNKSLK